MVAPPPGARARSTLPGTMRKSVKITLGAVAVVLLALAALGATAAYYVMRNLEERPAGEAEAVKAIDAVKARFPPRPPLIEIADPRRADVRINRAADPSPVPVDTIHVISWKSETRELSRVTMPLWLMRFSTVNLASHLNISPARLRLTVGDVERYGPGVIVDYGAPGSSRVFVWVE